MQTSLPITRECRGKLQGLPLQRLTEKHRYAGMAVAIAGDKFTERQEQEALMDLLDRGERMHAHPTGHAQENLKAAWGWASSV